MKKKLPSVKGVDLKGKRVLLRASLNVPIADGVVTNQFRIARALPTINHLRQAGARVIIVAHIGREKDETLEPVFNVFKQSLPITWSSQIVGPEVVALSKELKDGEVLLLENLRQDPREHDNDDEFAKELSELADIYVNDAFAASHRSHASLTGVPKYLPGYFGFNFVHEFDELSKALTPQSPSLFMLGGAKFETKLPLVDRFASSYTNVFIGGALANDIFKARGLEIGTSLQSDIDLRDHAIMNRLNIIAPVDVVVTGPNGVRTIEPTDVKKEEKILDAGPRTVELLADYVKDAKSILWNGPLGDFENGFGKSTEDLAKIVADSAGYSIIGGGDTIAAIETLCIQEKFNFMSTAGGAMLTFLETGTLPAIDAILKTEA